MNKSFVLIFLFLLPFGASFSEAASHKVDVFMAGTGVVGSALLEQIDRNHDILEKSYGVDIRVIALANSRQMSFSPDGIDLKNWKSALVLEYSWYKFLDLLFSNSGHAVFVDCTSNQSVANSYDTILGSRIPIVTPNKKANSSSYAYYQLLHSISAKNETPFFYDANVGAGLPIINTIQELLRSGDHIVKIDAILSGTLSFIFNSFIQGTNFSEIVLEAQKKGYTEPDPRDDLNGMDVLRKLLILARESGHALELNEIAFEGFLPQDCIEAESVEEFYNKLRSHDVEFAQMRDTALSQNKRLRFIASLEGDKAKLSLQAVDAAHPCYDLKGNDNIAVITTLYYNKNPLVIKGPGAGPDVTAARVLEGIVRCGLRGK